VKAMPTNGQIRDPSGVDTPTDARANPTGASAN
jgi:hypothetical protein